MTLAIYENNRLTRTEQVPFTRTGITPFDRVEWFMQAGETDNDDMSDERSAVVQAGIRLPVTSTLAVTSGATVKKNQRFVESAVDWSADSIPAPSMASSAHALATFMAARANAAISSKSATTMAFH